MLDEKCTGALGPAWDAAGIIELRLLEEDMLGSLWDPVSAEGHYSKNLVLLELV